MDGELLEKLVKNGFTELNNFILSAIKEFQHTRAGEAILDREYVL